MKVMIVVLVSVLSAATARAEIPDGGEPRLPREALQPLARGPELPAGLERLKQVGWDEPFPDIDGLSMKIMGALAEPPVVSASLWVSPSTSRLSDSGPEPRDCGEVRRERRQVRQWIRELGEVRDDADRELRYRERVCGRRPDCNWERMDRLLQKLNSLNAELRKYADAELASDPDRLVTYRFHLDTATGRGLLRDGWLPEGAVEVTRLRFHRGTWIGLAGATMLPGGFTAVPVADISGRWILSRQLRATEACTSNLVFNLEFLAPLRRGAEVQKVFVRAISL